MTTGSAKMSHGGAGGLAAYLADSETLRVSAYYGPEADGGGDKRPGRPRSFGADDVVFRTEQVYGRGVEAMGIELSRGLTFGQFKRLMEGRHSETGDQIVRMGHRTVVDPMTGEETSEGAHTMAIDVYFAAPKDVSLLVVAAAKAERHDLVRGVVAVHETAVREAMAVVEAECRLGRRTVKTPTELAAAGPRLVTKPGHEREGQASKQQGSKSERVTVDLVVISATQHTARPNDITEAAGRMADPHLHTHNAVAGPAWDSVAERWVQIDDYGLKSGAVRRDAIYMGALARGLQDLGVELDFDTFEDGKNGRAPWRVKGITQESVDFFSSNHQRKFDLKRDLEAHLGKAVSEKAVQVAMRVSRTRKSASVKRQDTNPVYELWNEDAERFDITIADNKLVQRLGDRGHAVEVASLDERRAEFFRRLYGEKGLTKDDAVFDGKTRLEAIARCAEGLSFTSDDLVQFDLEVMDQIIVQREANDPARQLFTTPQMLAVEDDVAQTLATKAAARNMSHPTKHNLARAIDNLDVEPDDEQRAAIDAAASGRGLSIIEGWAGTGKTTSLKAVVDAGRLPGHDGQPAYDAVVVVSTASLTALGTGTKLRADASCSIEGFVHRVEQGRLKPTDRTLVVVDEAAMTNSYSQQRLLEAAGPAQLVLVGDTAQALPIGPGGTFQAAVEAHGSQELTKVWRHSNDEDTAAFALLRNGKAPAMIDNLERRGRFYVTDTATERIDLAVDTYEVFREAGREASEVRIVLDSSNVAVDDINRHVQRIRRERGELGEQFFDVEARSTGRRWRLQTHDLVLFLAPTKCGKNVVPNGSTGEIMSINASRGLVVVRLDVEDKSTPEHMRLRSVKLSAGAHDQPLGLAYGVHNQKYQGAEIPIELYLPGSAGTTNRNSAYSSVTRCVEELHVFSDHETHGEDPDKTLGTAWRRSPAKETARSNMADDIASTTAERGDGAARVDYEPRRRTEDAYLARINRVGGAELREQVEKAPAYPALMSRLDELAKQGVNEREMLTQAVRERDFAGAQDPAAVLVHRLDTMTKMASDDVMTRSLTAPGLDRDDIMRQALDDERAQDQVRERTRDRRSIADDFTLGM